MKVDPYSTLVGSGSDREKITKGKKAKTLKTKVRKKKKMGKGRLAAIPIYRDC